MRIYVLGLRIGQGHGSGVVGKGRGVENWVEEERKKTEPKSVPNSELKFQNLP